MTIFESIVLSGGVISGLIAVAVFLSKNLIVTRLQAAVRNEFAEKLAGVQSELRQTETELSDLRGGVLSAMTSRQIAMNSRRIQAVDEL